MRAILGSEVTMRLIKPKTFYVRKMGYEYR